MSIIFAQQDRTGTVAQITVAAAPANPIAVNDTGTIAGVQPWNGNEVSLAFTVGQILNTAQFGITTALPNGAGPGEVLQSGWPEAGSVITWITGANAETTSAVTQMVPANAYITSNFFKEYHASRGNVYGTPTTAQLQQAIVQGTDYLDQWYRFKGVKLLQFLGGNDILDPMLPFIDPWLSPFGFTQTAFYVPSTTQQATEWPRQGVVDFNGDNVYGIPKAISFGCAELALRMINGIILQPDYDPTVVLAGAIIESASQEVGPIKVSATYDTKLGIGFFADFPHVSRLLAKAGLLIASGGHQIIR
jgi:hypothetical protein